MSATMNARKKASIVHPFWTFTVTSRLTFRVVGFMTGPPFRLLSQ